MNRYTPDAFFTHYKVRVNATGETTRQAFTLEDVRALGVLAHAEEYLEDGLTYDDARHLIDRWNRAQRAHLNEVTYDLVYFNPAVVANFMQAKGYNCTVEGDVQDPVYVTSGTAAGRFVEFKAVTLRSDAEARKFLADRS